MRDRFQKAKTFDEYLETVEKNRELWRGVYERAKVPDELAAAARATGDHWNLVALTEDWCGDAVNTLPVVARLAEAAGWSLRVMERDQNPDLMDAHLTGEHSRSIPVVIVYDDDFNEIAWWGPRPDSIQRWVLDNLEMDSGERYREVRRFYAKDKGASTLRELLDVMGARVPA